MPVAGLNQVQAGGSRQSQVSEMALRQAQSAKQLHEVVDALEQRLSSILLPIGPSPSSDSTKTPGRNLVQHAAHLSETAELIEAAAARLNDLIQRIEL